MPPASIQEIRREELIDATFQVIKREGLRFTTVSRIEKEAGASKGSLHYYFRDREKLIELSVRRVFALRHAKFLKRLKASKNPSERLWAIVAVNLDPKYLEPGFCRAWISLAAEATENDRLARILRALHDRERSNLIHALRELHHEPNVVSASLGLKLLFEGVRYRAGFLTLKYAPQLERTYLLAYMKQNIPNFDPSAAKHQ